MSIERIAIEDGDVRLHFENGWPVLYMVTMLKKIVVKSRCEPAGKVEVQNLFRVAWNVMQKKWNDSWMRVMSPIAMLVHVTGLGGRFPVTEESTLGWDQGFYFGVMMERYRQRHGVDITYEVFDVTPEEMKKVCSNEDDDEDEEDT